MAANLPTLPHTIPGLIYTANLHGFLIKEKAEGRKYPKLFIDKKIFQQYIKQSTLFYTVADIAKELKTSISGVQYTIFIKMQLKGRTKYGKIYFTTEEKNKILEYYRNKKCNIKKRTK